MPKTKRKDDEFHAWNPGLSSTIPPHLLPQVTLFRPENAYVSYAEAEEASALCGLPIVRMSDLRFERLVVHELLVQVTASLSVPDGPDYEYLGLMLRDMVKTIHEKHLKKLLPALEAEYETLRQEVKERMLAILEQKDLTNTPAKKGFLTKILGKQSKDTSKQSREAMDIKRIESWQGASAKAQSEGDEREAAIFSALKELGEATLSHRGHLPSDDALFATLSLRLFCQDYGVSFVRRLISPIFAEAANKEGFRFLPSQQRRIVMNTKGASAAGKSTIRPQQRLLAESLGIAWEDFALISPDYWRKYLLEYESLGKDYKYAAMLTGQELAMIDLKLDSFVAERATKDDVPHLLIDRFRFDSFQVDGEGDYQSNLLTRFADMVFLFFIITPPAETVERAWHRGLKTQRYKAVDDLLYHNHEAFTGIPSLFFSWIGAADKALHFEFLDNGVALGERPRTAAFCKDGHMVILDPEALNNVDRFREVNVEASTPEEVLLDTDKSLEYSFLKQCVKKVNRITLADFDTGKIYGRIERGKWLAGDTKKLKANEALFKTMGWDSSVPAIKNETLDIKSAQRHTLGRWGKSF